MCFYVFFFSRKSAKRFACKIVRDTKQKCSPKTLRSGGIRQPVFEGGGRTGNIKI